MLARNNTWIVADTLNGTPLPSKLLAEDLSLFSRLHRLFGKKVGNITQILLNDFVTPPGGPVAAFSAAPLSGTAPLTVQFTDQSTVTGPLTYAWDFDNDGTVDTTLQYPQ